MSKYKKGSLYLEMRVSPTHSGLVIMDTKERGTWIRYWGNTDLTETHWKKRDYLRINKLFIYDEYFEEL